MPLVVSVSVVLYITGWQDSIFPASTSRHHLEISLDADPIEQIMMLEILTRLILALTFVLAGIAVYNLANRLLIKRLQNNLLTPVKTGLPVLLYFTTPSCAPCKTVQRPAIEQIKHELGERLQVVEIDATAQPEQASHWGVLSVPTIILLDSAGRPRHINHGVTLKEKLRQQIQSLF